MEMTIGQIARECNISTRALRYYEQIGLITSEKKENHAYRVYSDDTVKRLRQIIVLRKLRIPLKQITEILRSDGASALIDAFSINLSEIDEEIATLSTIRGIINGFLHRLNAMLLSASVQTGLEMLSDAEVLEAVGSLTVQKADLKGEKSVKALNDLNGAKLNDRDVRILSLPPSAVAAVRLSGDDCESRAYAMVDAFVDDSMLHAVKPDFRVFGLCDPTKDEADSFEAWVTIPDGMDVPAHFEKKQFGGGLYAARTIPMGEFEEWQRVCEWVTTNARFASALSEMRYSPSDPGMGYALEETLNYHNAMAHPKHAAAVRQMDLLFPIKSRFAASTRHPQERIIDTFLYNGVPAEVVEWATTIWCGKIGYAVNNTDEPDVEAIMSAFQALDFAAVVGRTEADWDVCLSVNYLAKDRPNGVMFGFAVNTCEQPEGFDVMKVEAGRFIRISLNDETAFAVGDQPWTTGIPPYQWVGEQLAPAFGYRYGSDRLPIIEYYGYYSFEKMAHEFRYLYVPVEKL